jgi:hypothetical protein
MSVRDSYSHYQMGAIPDKRLPETGLPSVPLSLWFFASFDTLFGVKPRGTT